MIETSPKMAMTAEAPKPQVRSLWAILQDATGLYVKHWLPFTTILVKSVGFLTIGSFISLLGPIWVINLLEKQASLVNPVVLILTMAIPLVPGTYLFLQGFWEYLVYTVSLNLNTVEAENRQPFDFSGAYQSILRKSGAYGNLLLALAAIWTPSVVCFFLPQWVMPSLLMTLAGFILGGILSLAAAIFSIYFSLSLQVLAFEPVSLNPMPILKRSYHLVEGSFGRVLVLVVGIGVLMNFLLPLLVTSVFALTHLTDVLAPLLIQNLMSEVFANVKLSALFGEGGMFTMADEYMASHLPAMSRSMFDVILSNLVTFFVLPYGTMVFTLLYSDLAARRAQQGE